jgi:3-methylfumaryl-CoA hydratase
MSPPAVRPARRSCRLRGAEPRLSRGSPGPLGRPAGALGNGPAPALPLRQLSDTEWEFRTDPSLLARFSAVTANAHRIHYDWPYATRVEGYPGLVVHGPLQAIALAETHRLRGGAHILRLRHRGRAPLFCGETARLRTTSHNNGSSLVEMVGVNYDAIGPTATVELMTSASIQ